MFPEYSPQLQNTKDSETTQMGKSFLFDFQAGDFVVKDGKLQAVDGIEALKMRIEKVVRTEKFKFKIYETGDKNEYGITTLELVTSGLPQFFIQAELQREISEALLADPDINSVEDFTFTRDKRMLIASFTVNSIYGSFPEEVKF